MTQIIDGARDLMAVMSPLTGTRATGTLTITASGADVDVPAASYLVPEYDGRYRPDLAIKVLAGDNDDKSITVTSSGTSVPCVANLGGVIFNKLADATVYKFDPPMTGIASAVGDGAFTGGAAATGLTAVKSMVMYEQFRPGSAWLDLARSSIKDFPAVLVAWQDSEPADGSAVDQTQQMRVSALATLYHETYQILVISARSESGHYRRLAGAYILDEITARLTSRVDYDDGVISAPSGIQIRQRFRREIPSNDTLRFYIYGLLVSLMRPYHMTDERTYEDLEEVVVDIVRPFTVAEGGDIAIVGDGVLGKPGMVLDMT